MWNSLNLCDLHGGFSKCRVFGSNEYISFNVMAKQTPYRYSADAKDVLRNVYDFCKREKEGGVEDISQSGNGTGFDSYRVSKSTIVRILKQDNVQDQKPQLPRTLRVQLDTFDLGVLHRTVNTLYSDKRILPTLNNILTELQENIGNTGSESILRKHMLKLRFTYKKSQTNRKLLMERGDVVISRIRYLRKIPQLREAGCNIVYTDETYVHSNHTVSKTWQDGDIGANIPFSKGKICMNN